MIYPKGMSRMPGLHFSKLGGACLIVVTSALAASLVMPASASHGGPVSGAAQTTSANSAVRSLPSGQSFWVRKAGNRTSAMEIVRSGSTVRILEVGPRYFYCSAGTQRGTVFKGYTKRGVYPRRDVRVTFVLSGSRLTKNGKVWRSVSEKAANRAMLAQDRNAASLDDLWNACQSIL